MNGPFFFFFFFAPSTFAVFVFYLLLQKKKRKFIGRLFNCNMYKEGCLDLDLVV